MSPAIRVRCAPRPTRSGVSINMNRRAHNPTDDFAGLVQRFFAEYLAAQRNLSPHTRLSYRNTFRLLLRFLAEQHRRSVDQLTLGTLTPESILAFLDHLERTRRNSPRTRNVRLPPSAPLCARAGTAALEFLGRARALAIPPKILPCRARLHDAGRDRCSPAATDQNTVRRRDPHPAALQHRRAFPERCKLHAMLTTTSFFSTAKVARNASAARPQNRATTAAVAYRTNRPDHLVRQIAGDR